MSKMYMCSQCDALYDSQCEAIYCCDETEALKANAALNRVMELEWKGRAKKTEAQLEAMKSIRANYANLVAQERGLIGADTALDMIDAVLEMNHE